MNGDGPEKDLANKGLLMPPTKSSPRHATAAQGAMKEGTEEGYACQAERTVVPSLPSPPSLRGSAQVVDASASWSRFADASSFGPTGVNGTCLAVNKESRY